MRAQPRRFSYAGVLAGVLAATVPLEPCWGLRALRRPRRMAAALAPVFAAFAGADLAALRASWWSLDPAQTSGLALPGGLPAEEAAFFVVVPAAAVLTWEAIRATLPELVD